MLFAGIVISAVAMFLGLITKLPQGGGGLANNLMAITFFLPAPPLPPLRLQTRILFDLETAIAENQLYYLSNPVVTRNGTYGPMPRPLYKLSSSSTDKPTFTFPTFDSSAFSLPRELIQFWASIGTAIVVFMALWLPWLLIKKMYILGKAGPALQAASGTTVTEYGALVAQIEPLNPLLEDLRIIISEHDQASANLWSISKQAWETENKATEKAAKLEEERKSEVDGLREEILRLQGEALDQTKIWEEKEKEWEVERADEKQRHNEAIDGLKMSREMETESWRRKQVEDLERAKDGETEAFGAQLKKMVERMKKEREGWGVEEEAWKEEMAKEKGEWEEKRIEEEKSWAKDSDRAQKRIADLEAENQSLKDSEAERQKQATEAEAAMKTANAEKEQGRKHAEEEANKAIARLENEVLNGRMLIEDLQADKRRDRQLLLELRAQLVRPTYPVPPHQMNPFRFGGTAPPPFMGGPFIPGSSAFATTGPSAFSPITGDSAFPIGSSPSDFNPQSATPLPSLLPSARPTVRLPPQPPSNPAQLPAPFQPPSNAPKGPKGWSGGPKRGQ